MSYTDIYIYVYIYIYIIRPEQRGGVRGPRRSRAEQRCCKPRDWRQMSWPHLRYRSHAVTHAHTPRAEIPQLSWAKCQKASRTVEGHCSTLLCMCERVSKRVRDSTAKASCLLSPQESPKNEPTEPSSLVASSFTHTIRIQKKILLLLPH